ncbi:prepilin peptidase [Jannaschia sp. 2305UL9-9]|uniref:prepilin peptidase n=1 Tax=Jannaschia sp. 2305UL9-9 TaxID=3121638 RepID=UPI003527E023
MFTDLAITQTQGLIFGLLTLPITLWVIYTDLTEQKIKNKAVLAMLAVFVVAGIFLMPLEDYAWRYAHFAIALAIGFVLSMVGIGAGDVKYAASVAPFVALPDLQAVGVLYIGWSVILIVGILIAWRIPALRRAYPDWVWFGEAGKGRKSKIPLGLALAPAASSYFLLGAIGG